VRESTRAVAIARRLVLLLLCAVLGTWSLATAPARAEGVEGMTAVEQEHLSQLAEWAYRNGATVEAPDCGDVCSDLWLAEHQTMPNQATSDELWGELNALEDTSATEGGVGLLPDLGTFARAISPYAAEIALAPAAFELGWHIGGKVDKWLGIAVPAQPTEVATETLSLQWYPQGSTEPFPTYHTRVAMPFSGFVVMSQNLAGVVGQQSSGPPEWCEKPGPQTFPAGFLVLRWWWNDCWTGYWSPTIPITAVGLVAQPETLVPGPVQDYDGQSSEATTRGLADPGREVVERRLQEALESGRYPLLNQWLDHELGGRSPDPLCEPVAGARTVRVPAIMPGQTAADYENCLDSLGLRNHVQVTVPVEQAVLAQPARGVVGVEPAEGTSVSLESETQATVKENPDPLPDPSELGDPEGECEPSSGEYPVAVPPNDPTPELFDVINDASLVERQTFLSTRGNTVLRWGEVIPTAGFAGWGYQHIKAKHGWGSVDERATRDALLTSGFPNRKRAESWDFFGPAYTQGRTLCTREVVVNFGVQGEEAEPRGIITSYGRPVDQLPAVMRSAE
jgi:hypothetical protein